MKKKVRRRNKKIQESVESARIVEPVKKSRNRKTEE